jgi:hypothetical protein
MAATESGVDTTLGSSVAPLTELGPGTPPERRPSIDVAFPQAAASAGPPHARRAYLAGALADERLLPVVAALRPLLPGRGLRRGTTVTVSRSAALALALVAGASAAGSWMAAVGLPDLGIVAAAETGIALERLALVPTPGARAWPAVVAALLDAVDVVLVRAPARLPPAQARRLAARARERGAVLVPLGAWPGPADLRLAVTASTWSGLGQGHGNLQARQVEVLVAGRGAATRERRGLLWLPSPSGTIAPVAGTGDARVGPGGPAGLALAGEGDAPAGEGRPPGAPELPLADAG